MNRQNLSPGCHQSELGSEGPQWVCVATAPDQLLAEMWQQLLLEVSIPSMLAPQDTISFLGVMPLPVRLMVPLGMGPKAEETLAGLVVGDADSDPEEAN